MYAKKELQRVRAALSGRAKGPGRRLSPEARRLVVEYARRRSGEGASNRVIGQEIGIGDRTVARALDADARVALVPVRVVSERRAVVTVRAPGGLTIEGLDVAGLAALIRVLS